MGRRRRRPRPDPRRGCRASRRRPPLPDAPALYERLGWRLFPSIDRVYVNDAARADLGWTPEYDFRTALDLLAAGRLPRSELALTVGAKGYHAVPTGPYTTR